MDYWVVIKIISSHFVKFKGMSIRCMVTMIVIGVATGIKIVKPMNGDGIQRITIKMGNIICIKNLTNVHFILC